jgi:phytoene dehydrogenase-like protein
MQTTSKSAAVPHFYHYVYCLMYSYVLLHHVMGELDGIKGAWAYVEGGMGAVSESIAKAARSLGAHIYTSKVGAVHCIRNLSGIL